MRDLIENVNKSVSGKPRKFGSKFHMKNQDYVVFEHATSDVNARLQDYVT